jgi:ATP-dependent protease ClpP protease subunit
MAEVVKNPIAKITGVIGGKKGMSAAAFDSILASAIAQDGDSVDVHIHSAGGSIADGNAIINAIKNSAKPVTTYNDGIAYSMAAAIFISAPNRFMAKNALLMIHGGSLEVQGTAESLREAADVLDKYNHTLAVTLADATGKTVEEVTALYLDGKDHYFTAEEAVAAGLATGIAEYEAIASIPDNIRSMDYAEVVAFVESTPKAASNDIEGWDLYRTSDLFNCLVNQMNVCDDLENSDNTMLADFAKQVSVSAANNIVALAKMLQESEASDVQAMMKKFAEPTATAEKRALEIEAMVSATVVSALNTEKETLVASVATLTNQFTTENAARVKAEADLATAIAAKDAEITALKNKFPGAAHGGQPQGGDGDGGAEAEVKQKLSAMAHNQMADELLPKSFNQN